MPRLSDELLLAKPVLTTLRARFAMEAEMEEGNGQFYAVIHKADGSFTDHNPYSPELDPMQAEFARDCLRLFNRELHHDGAWVAIFTHPKPAGPLQTCTEYARFGFIFIDKDGDAQFTVDWEDGTGELLDFSDCLLAGIDAWGDIAEAAWESWHTLMREALDPSEGQLIKKAQGQLSTAMH